MPGNSASFYLSQLLGNSSVLAESFTCTCMQDVEGRAGVCKPAVFWTMLPVSFTKNASFSDSYHGGDAPWALKA